MQGVREGLVFTLITGRVRLNVGSLDTSGADLVRPSHFFYTMAAQFKLGKLGKLDTENDN